MSMLSRDQYLTAEADFIAALSSCKDKLSSEAIEHVRHYLDHAEIEMAYESLGLSLMVENVVIPQATKEILYSLGLVLNLDEGGVFDVDFWRKFLPILKS